MHLPCTHGIKAEADSLEVEGDSRGGKKNGKWSANEKNIKYENVIIKQLFYILSKTANQKRNTTIYNQNIVLIVQKCFIFKVDII